MDIRKRLKEIEEILPGDYGDLSSAKKYLDSIEKVTNVEKLLSVFEEFKDMKPDNKHGYTHDFICYLYQAYSNRLRFVTYSLKDI
ncbi:MAG: hypothetical protein QXI58_03985, partial [Candidatus Micrarchaeia archaeon]